LRSFSTFIAKTLVQGAIGIVVIPLSCTGIVINVALLITGKGLNERVKAIFLDIRDAGALALVPGTVALLASRFSFFTFASPLTALVAIVVIIAALELQVGLSNQIAMNHEKGSEKWLKDVFGLVDHTLRPIQSQPTPMKEWEEEMIALYREYRVLISAYCAIAVQGGENDPDVQRHYRGEDVCFADLPVLPTENHLLDQLLEKKYGRAGYFWIFISLTNRWEKPLTWADVVERGTPQELTPTVFQQFTHLPFPDDLSHWKELVEIAQFAPDREVLRMFFGLPEGFSPEQLQSAVEPLKKRFTGNAAFLRLIEEVRFSLGS
jgi:hypothetical protein